MAVLGVVIFHAFPNALAGGFTGVDVFFVISGYLISTILFLGVAKGGFSLRDFYGRRIRRIYPALALMMGACLVFGWFALLPKEYLQLGKHAFKGSLFFSNFALWQEAGYFDIDSQLKPLMHLWSLAIEEQFYLLWPLAVLSLYRFRFSFLKTAAVAGLLSLGASLWMTWHYPESAFYMPFTRFWELMAGGILAYIHLYHRENFEARLPHPHILSVAGLALITIGMVAPIPLESFPGFWAVLPVLGAVMVIAAGERGVLNARILSARPAIWIGLISYPLYIWHWPILSFLRIVQSGPPPWEYQTVAVAAAFALAYATYIGVEKPVRHGKIPHAATGLFLIVLALGFAGLTIRKSHGFPDRPMPASEAQISSFTWDPSRNINAACVAKYGLQHSGLAYCIEDNPDKDARVAVIGDSHANQMFWALRGYYRDKGQNLVNLGGPGECLPLYGSDALADGCKDMMDDVLRVIERDNIRTVILSTRAGYITDYTTFQSLLGHTFEKFAALNKDVVFVLDVPEMDFDPKLCMERRFRINDPSAPLTCGVSREKTDQMQRAYREAVFAAAKPYRNVQFLDLTVILCDAHTCSGRKEDMILYRDKHHLSQWGAAYVGRHISLSAGPGR